MPGYSAEDFAQRVGLIGKRERAGLGINDVFQ